MLISRALFHFILTNTAASDINLTNLQLEKIEQLGDVSGMNATLLHDTIILNFITDLGQSKNANLFNQLVLDDIDFSMLQVLDF